MTKNIDKKTIIAIWTWSKGDNTPKIGLNIPDEWQTPDGHFLVCADIRKEGAWETSISELIRQYLETGEVMLFLHKNSPHYFGEGDVSTILNQHRESLGIRVRLFGGGTEPLYFGWDNELGIIGVDGGFPISTDRYTTIFEEKYSNLVVSNQLKQVRQQHFNHIWQTYWDLPHKNLLDLTQRFRLHGMGYVSGTPLVEYLKSDGILWDRLVCFAGLAAKLPISANARAAEYNFDAYEAHLAHHGNLKALGQVRETRQVVHKLLDAPPDNNVDGSHTIETVFNALLNLFKAIPPND